jgi:hypothetical protein
MGRKAKPKISQREMEDEVIWKYMNHEPMTLEEASLALHMYDNAHGIKSKRPMTKMGFLKLESRILQKLRKACEDAGLGPEVLQMFGNCKRECATINRGLRPSDD